MSHGSGGTSSTSRSSGGYGGGYSGGSSYGGSSRSSGSYGSGSYGSSSSSTRSSGSYGSSTHSSGSSSSSSSGSSSRSSGSYGSGSSGSSTRSSGSYGSGSTGSSTRSSGSSSSGSTYGSDGYTRHGGSSSGTSSSSSSSTSTKTGGSSTGTRSSGSSTSSGSSSSSTSTRSGGSSTGTKTGGSGSYGYSSGSYRSYTGSSRKNYSYGSDSYTKKVDQNTYNSQVNNIRTGGSYHRDVRYDTHVTNKTTIVVNDNHYYAPTYYSSHSHYSSWGGGFWAGYLAGSIDQAIWDNNYRAWNTVALGSYWATPYTVWNPYYASVLAAPLVVDTDWAVAENWQHPALNKNQDPLEQLAFYHQLTQPQTVHVSGWFGLGGHDEVQNREVTAEQARAALSAGQTVNVAGVAVNSFAQLAQIVPEMAQGQTVQGQTLPAEAQQALQSTVANGGVSASTLANSSADDLASKLPDFSQVYSPRNLQAEEQIDGKNINRTMDSAESIYQRPEVRAAIAQWWKENPTADRDALNTQINAIVTKALKDDLAANADAYAKDPTLESNPVDYLKDPSTDAANADYNKKAIQTVIDNAETELAQNVITKANANAPQS